MFVHLITVSWTLYYNFNALRNIDTVLYGFWCSSMLNHNFYMLRSAEMSLLPRLRKAPVTIPFFLPPTVGAQAIS